MDVSSISSNVSNITNLFSENNNTGASEVAENADVEAEYAVKLIKMAQQSAEVVGSILEDTAEISQEAMNKFLSEKR